MIRLEETLGPRWLGGPPSSPPVRVRSAWARSSERPPPQLHAPPLRGRTAPSGSLPAGVRQPTPAVARSRLVAGHAVRGGCSALLGVPRHMANAAVLVARRHQHVPRRWGSW